MANERDLILTESLSVLVAPETRGRIEALVIARREKGVGWPNRSTGAVVRSVLDAGLDVMERKAARAGARRKD